LSSILLMHVKDIFWSVIHIGFTFHIRWTGKVISTLWLQYVLVLLVRVFFKIIIIIINHTVENVLIVFSTLYISLFSYIQVYWCVAVMKFSNKTIWVYIVISLHTILFLYYLYISYMSDLLTLKLVRVLGLVFIYFSICIYLLLLFDLCVLNKFMF